MVVDLRLPNGANPSHLICATRSLLNFLYLAQYPVHSTTTLALLTNSLSEFHKNKDIFVDLGIRENFNIPKLHFLKHYEDFIKLHGTTDNYSTEYMEHLHIDLVKDAFHATNRKDEYPQMMNWLERREKLWRHAAYIQWRLDGEPDLLQQVEEAEPLSCLSLSKRPSRRGIQLPQVIEDYGAKEFSDSFAQYWVNLTQPGLSPREATNAVQNYHLPFQKISVFHKVKFYNVNIKGYPGSSDPRDSVHVQPSRKDKRGCDIAGRFDTALVVSDLTPKQGDIRGKAIIFFFQIKSHPCEQITV